MRDGWKNDLSIEAKQIKACQLSSVGYNIIFWSDTKFTRTASVSEEVQTSGNSLRTGAAGLMHHSIIQLHEFFKKYKTS